VRVEEYPPEKIEDLDYYYKKLARRDKEKVAKILIVILTNIRKLRYAKQYVFIFLNLRIRTEFQGGCQSQSPNEEIALDGLVWA
jgi:hypothetical protein